MDQKILRTMIEMYGGEIAIEFWVLSPLILPRSMRRLKITNLTSSKRFYHADQEGLDGCDCSRHIDI